MAAKKNFTWKSRPESMESTIMVEDDTEFDAVSGVFASMLDDEADITY